MGYIDVPAVQLKQTLEVLDNQIRQFKGSKAGRELSANEHRALKTLEDEYSAVKALFETACQAEDREEERRCKAGSQWLNIQAADEEARARGFRDSEAERAAAERRELVNRVAYSDEGRLIGGWELGKGPVSLAGGTPVTERVDPAVAEFRSYIRTGEVRSFNSTDAQGGYLIPNPVVADVVNRLKAQDPILARARIFQMEGGNTSLEIPIVDTLGATAWTTEAAERTEQTAPTFTQRLLTCYEIYTDWRATQTFIDSVPGVENWISSEITSTMLAAAGIRFAVGSGQNQIKGLFANTQNGYQVVASDDALHITEDAFTRAYAALPQKFQPAAVWIMLPATFGETLNLTYPGTQIPLVQFVQGAPTILGKPVLLSDSAPAIDAETFPIFYGDLASAYAVGIHRNVTILRDPYSNKPYVSFYATMRIGGVPLDNQAGVLVQVRGETIS